MHKIYLTRPEASIIHGAERIVAEFGGFPSMENAKLCRINIKDSELPYGRYDISLLFDIWHWGEVSSLYMDIPIPAHRFIELSFQRARDISVNSPYMMECGEFKFGNTTDRKKMYQDDMPSNTIIVERPFCSFYMQAGRDFVIEFEEDECLISATLRDNL